MKLKKKNIGQKTFSKLLNKMMTIEEDAVGTLLTEGRFDLFESLPKKTLKPKAKKETEEVIEEIKKENKKD